MYNCIDYEFFWRDLIDIIDQDIKQFISEGQVSVTPYREQL